MVTVGEYVITAEEIAEQARGLKLLRIYWLQYTLAGEALRAYRRGDLSRVAEVKDVVDEARSMLEPYAESGDLGASVYVVQLAGMSQFLAQMLESREPSRDVGKLAASLSDEDLVKLEEELAARALKAYLAEDLKELRGLRELILSILRRSRPERKRVERLCGVESFISAAIVELEAEH
ncbi:MAG: hypothetical protein DRN96_05335 [Thermoproteota archaeon]|nr:MAG: hypothetical protein DRN96_05335 [Candidatus Korarchaeota archaeon]RLG52266.1 MAG: hypothetical protein DRN99_07765 [Candidatus Korarchaeota archaeon]